MKKLFALSTLLFIYTSLAAQKHDYQWLFGSYNSYAETNELRGGRTVNFNFTPCKVDSSIKRAGFDGANISYCNADGNLSMYSNGADIYDSRDSIMMGGDSLNYGWFWEYWITDSASRYEGLSLLQSMLALPDPGDSLQMYLTHFTVRFNWPTGGTPSYLTDTTYYSKVDFGGNFGFGTVTSKNQKLNWDTLTYSNLSAVKHGNGRDWWIIRPYYQGNCYYTFLLTDTGLGLSHIQCAGSMHHGYGDLGSSCFSPDGEKYFWVTSTDGIYMFDFDRCTGMLSNGQIIPWPYPTFKDSINLAGGVAVSPNNRFLYVTTSVIVLQYDLLAPDIGASVDTVAFWDGGYDPMPPLASTFFLEQLGPDGKIYINASNSTISLHVINRPDEQGDSCLFVQRGLKLNTYNSTSMPNFPNYRLGALAGSACDTLSTLTEDIRAEKEKLLKVYPNPAKDIITIDYGFTDWNKGDVNLEISNTLGQVVYSQSIPRYSGFQRIDVSGFSVGAYQAAIMRKRAVVAVAKFVKE